MVRLLNLTLPSLILLLMLANRVVYAAPQPSVSTDAASTTTNQVEQEPDKLFTKKYSLYHFLTQHLGGLPKARHIRELKYRLPLILHALQPILDSNKNSKILLKNASLYSSGSIHIHATETQHKLVEEQYSFWKKHGMYKVNLKMSWILVPPNQLQDLQTQFSKNKDSNNSESSTSLTSTREMLFPEYDAVNQPRNKPCFFPPQIVEPEFISILSRQDISQLLEQIENTSNAKVISEPDIHSVTGRALKYYRGTPEMIWGVKLRNSRENPQLPLELIEEKVELGTNLWIWPVYQKKEKSNRITFAFEQKGISRYIKPSSEFFKDENWFTWEPIKMTPSLTAIGNGGLAGVAGNMGGGLLNQNDVNIPSIPKTPTIPVYFYSGTLNLPNGHGCLISTNIRTTITGERLVLLLVCETETPEAY